MILVTGATGNNGSEIVKALAASGADVRGMVRKYPDCGRTVLPGVELVTADFEDPVSIRRALEGTDRAFLVTNSSERAEAQQLGFVEQARAAGLRHIVYLRSCTRPPTLPCASCAITRSWKKPSPHPEWRSRTCVLISTCRPCLDSAHRLRRRASFMHQPGMHV